MRRRLGLVTLLPALVLLTACGPDHGRVHDRHYSAGYASTTTSCSGSSKTRSCHSSSHWNPPSWHLDVYASTDDHGWVSVDQHTFDRCQVGAYYDHGGCR